MIETRPVTYEAMGHLAANMRTVDAHEIWHLNGSYPSAAIVDAVMVSDDKCAAAYWNGNLLCIYGCAEISTLGRVGSPWLLGTHEMDRHGLDLIATSRIAQSQMFETYDVLTNSVWAENRRSIAYLKRLGFTFSEPKVLGSSDVVYYDFQMTKDEYRDV